MASSPGEMPGIKFDPEPLEYYDHQVIAGEVVWPLVNYYTRQDWIRDSQIADKFNLVIGGTYERKEYDAVLNAYNNLLEDDEDTEEGPPVVPTATLELESVVYDSRRDFVIALANHQGADIDEDSHEGVAVKIATAYTFDTDGAFAIRRSRSIERLDGTAVWFAGLYDHESTGENAETDEGVPDSIPINTILDEDMELLKTGLYILRAPKALHVALRVIRPQSANIY